jgi:hypothetical protein
MSKSLIVVDIQPFYHQYHKNITPQLLEHIRDNSNQYKNIIWFFNAEEVIGIEEDIHDMTDYIMDFEIISEDQFDSINFIDKDFGFFRNWLDAQVDDDFIKYVVKHMIQEDVVDSRELDEEVFKMLFQTYFNLNEEDLQNEWADEYKFFLDNPINIPQFKWQAIRNLGNVDLCGGSENECLAEIEILLEAVDVKVNKLNKFIYQA